MSYQFHLRRLLLPSFGALRNQELQTANFQLSQQAQTAGLIAELRPCAKPAYITCSPYTTAYGACGCSV